MTRIEKALKVCEKLHKRPITATLFARHYKPIYTNRCIDGEISVYTAANLLKELCAAGYLIKVSRGAYMIKGVKNAQ